MLKLVSGEEGEKKDTILHCAFSSFIPCAPHLPIKSRRRQKYVGYSSVDKAPQPMNNIDRIAAIHRSHLTVHLPDTSGIFIFRFKQV